MSKLLRILLISGCTSIQETVPTLAFRGGQKSTSSSLLWIEFLDPPDLNSDTGTLSLGVMLFRGRVFGTFWLGEVIRVALSPVKLSGLRLTVLHSAVPYEKYNFNLMVCHPQDTRQNLPDPTLMSGSLQIVGAKLLFIRYGLCYSSLR